MGAPFRLDGIEMVRKGVSPFGISVNVAFDRADGLIQRGLSGYGLCIRNCGNDAESEITPAGVQVTRGNLAGHDVYDRRGIAKNWKHKIPELGLRFLISDFLS